jgi:ankyrin repeat protein
MPCLQTCLPCSAGSIASRRLGSVIALVTALWVFAAVASAAEIHDLIEQGDLEGVRRLLAEDPAHLTARLGDGKTPLHVAAYGGHDRIVAFLIARGADVNAQTTNGSTPLHGAAYSGHAACAGMLLKAGANPMAANSSGYTPFHGAAAGGSAEVVRLFLDEGVDINARKHGGETALILAALGNHHDLARWLIEQGANLEVRDDYGRTALLLVARETGDVEMARLLLEQGADVNAVDRGDDTPLTLSAWRGFRELTDLLLENGAETDARGPAGRFLLSCAAEKGLPRLFTILAEGGADLNVRNENGGSLLHSAAEGGSVEIAATLLERGLDVHEADRYGWTPLHYAAKKGRLAAAELLIGAGADLDRRTLAGYTPCSLAKEFKRNDVLDLLEKKGAIATAPVFPELKGPYFGQIPPGDEPQLFAVDIVSSNRFEHGSVAFSPDGTEAFWESSYMLADAGYSYSRILTSRVENGLWTAPRIAEFSGVQLGDDVPLFSQDGTRLYFLSGRPLEPGGPGGERVWFIERAGDGWSAPEPIRGGPNSMNHHWQFGVAANGNVYIGSSDPGGHGRGDLYVSKFVDGRYLEPENLGPTVNGQYDEASPFIAPDESCLIFTRFGDPADIGGADLCVSFRDSTGRWTEPIGLPEPINTRSNEICPCLSPDGKYLFFNSFRSGGADIYWVSADVIETLRPPDSR